ncbi:COBRA-like protein 10 [Elaeis guineensis]|uniref:COBRA-like protein 10 n=1 Tax=Elaeis guineensis var. tenera TaxID=51953 RepID=A0A6I9RBN8_ELAGV|nr:COBRA-like protein 10 [Elaeis guineensis]
MPPRALLFAVFIISFSISTGVRAQDESNDAQTAEPSAADNCIGVFLTYTLMSRMKEYPYVKNASAQSYAFKSTATLLNTMTEDLVAWKMFIGFQHDEILVSVSGAVITDGTGYPAHVGNGTSLSGFPQTNLLNAIDTAGDLTQIQVKVDLIGTQFGVKPPGIPMPKTIKLHNDGFRCPAPSHKGSQMYVCCVKDPKFKAKTNTTRFLPLQKGDLLIFYDVIQAYGNNYLAQVTIENNNTIGRLDNWNLTWEWKRGEFIHSVKGAYTFKKDVYDCIYGEAGNYYESLDFSQVMNCEKKPIITDLPPERAHDNTIGNIPDCCKNGSLLPSIMDPSQSKAVFQVQVFKIPPDLNRTALYPPQNFKINGFLNPNYVCSPPIRVRPSEFPDPSGLMSETIALATWQVACNITRPKRKHSGCCVSFSAYYNDSVVPCNTCACGCAKAAGCDPDAPPLLLPSEALLIPFQNRTAKAKAWAEIKHRRLPNPLPCGDYCGVSINWHILSNYRNGWTARITLFNWGDYTFKNWFAAIRMDKAYPGYEKVYSFNGTKLDEFKNTLFFQGLEGAKNLLPVQDGKNPAVDPSVPGKQQSVVSFTKKQTPGIDVPRGDGFPTRLYFNGEECALPDDIPLGGGHRHSVSLLSIVLVAVMVFAPIKDNLC